MEQSPVIDTDRITSNDSRAVSSLPPNTDAGLVRLYVIVRRYRRLITLCTVVGTIGAAIVAFLLPNEYESTVNAVPPKRPQTGLESVVSGLSNALRDIGLARLGGPRTTATGYDFMVVLQSRSLLDSLIERFDLVTVYEITDAKSQDSARAMARKELLDRYEVEYDAAGNYLITITDRDRYRAAAMANAVVDIANSIARELDARESQIFLTAIQQRLDAVLARMDAIADSLEAVSKKTLMFAPLEQAHAAATALAESKAQLLSQEIVLSVLQERYGDGDPATEQQRRIVESLRQKVSDAENRPGFIGNFSLREAPRAAYDYLRYYTELETMMKLKAAMLPTLEEVRTSLVRNSPSLYILDPAVPAWKKSSPRRSLIIGGALVASALLGLLLALVMDTFHHLRNQLDLRTVRGTIEPSSSSTEHSP